MEMREGKKMKKLLLLVFLMLIMFVAGCTNAALNGTDTKTSSSSSHTASLTTSTQDQDKPAPVTTTTESGSEGDDGELVTSQGTDSSRVTHKDNTESQARTTKEHTTVPATSEISVTTTPRVTTVTTVTTRVVTTTTTTTTTRVTTKPVTTVDPLKGKVVIVNYAASSSAAGSVSGSTQQTVRYGETKTSSVTATAKLGYRFVGWSDGKKEATRSGDCPSENTLYTAIFEYDARELPVISVTTSTGREVESKEVYIDGTVAISNCEQEYLLEAMDMEIRGRGNFSWARSEKKSYRIKLSEKQNLLGQGTGKAKSWTLIANHCDQTLIRNFITLNYARKLDNLAFMSSAVSVDLYFNGEYRGVYTLCEQNQVNKHRVNIAENPESLLTGYLIEMTNYAAENVFHAGGRAYETKNDLSTDINLYNQQQKYIADIVQKCWNAVERGNREEIERLLDIPSVVDAYIVEELFKNKDDGWDSFYMYYDATVTGEKLHFGPIWDFDLTGGNADEGAAYYEGLWAGVGGQMQDNGWFIKLLNYSWFRALVTERWNELKSETDKIPGDIIAEAERGYRAYRRNFDKWQIFGQRINLEPPQVTSLRRYSQHYHDYSDWMKNRIDWLDSYFNDPSYYYDGSLNLSGKGTARSPYLISSAKDLLQFTLAVSNGQSFSGVYFRQTANIDMAGVSGYNGLGQDHTFAGVYDGGGYTVNVNISSYDGCVFPYVTGTVMNLFTTGTIQNSHHASGICRSVRQDGKIINCGSSIALSAERAGGIANSNQAGGGLIAGCVFTGSISGSIAESPINCYNDGRGGAFYGNYYIPGLPHNTAHIDPSTPKNETELSAELIANALNSQLSQTAAMAGVERSQLCSWTTVDGQPVMVTK